MSDSRTHSSTTPLTIGCNTLRKGYRRFDGSAIRQRLVHAGNETCLGTQISGYTGARIASVSFDPELVRLLFFLPGSASEGQDPEASKSSEEVRFNAIRGPTILMCSGCGGAFQALNNSAHGRHANRR